MRTERQKYDWELRGGRQQEAAAAAAAAAAAEPEQWVPGGGRNSRKQANAKPSSWSAARMSGAQGSMEEEEHDPVKVLHSLNAAQLKSVCKARGLAMGGKKEDLRDRVLDDFRGLMQQDPVSACAQLRDLASGKAMGDDEETRAAVNAVRAAEKECWNDAGGLRKAAADAESAGLSSSRYAHLSARADRVEQLAKEVEQKKKQQAAAAAELAAAEEKAKEAAAARAAAAEEEAAAADSSDDDAVIGKAREGWRPPPRRRAARARGRRRPPRPTLPLRPLPPPRVRAPAVSVRRPFVWMMNLWRRRRMPTSRSRSVPREVAVLLLRRLPLRTVATRRWRDLRHLPQRREEGRLRRRRERARRPLRRLRRRRTVVRRRWRRGRRRSVRR